MCFCSFRKMKSTPVSITRDHVPRRTDQCNLHTHVDSLILKAPIAIVQSRHTLHTHPPSHMSHSHTERAHIPARTTAPQAHTPHAHARARGSRCRSLLFPFRVLVSLKPTRGVRLVDFSEDPTPYLPTPYLRHDRRGFTPTHDSQQRTSGTHAVSSLQESRHPY